MNYCTIILSTVNILTFMNKFILLIFVHVLEVSKFEQVAELKMR